PRPALRALPAMDRPRLFGLPMPIAPIRTRSLADGCTSRRSCASARPSRAYHTRRPAPTGTAASERSRKPRRDRLPLVMSVALLRDVPGRDVDRQMHRPPGRDFDRVLVLEQLAVNRLLDGRRFAVQSDRVFARRQTATAPVVLVRGEPAV